jgi:mono/diheme cytochrome c family protein
MLLSFQSGENYTVPVNKAITLRNDFAGRFPELTRTFHAFRDWQNASLCAKVKNRRLFVKLLLTNLAIGLVAASAAAAPVDYTREVKPLFAEHCYRCHGASQQKSGLRLDTAALAIKGGERGPAFKPGKSSDSVIVQAVNGAHNSIPRMPFKKPPLSETEIALLARWIDEGAAAPKDEQPEKNMHWAFVAPSRPPVPASAHRKAKSVNPVDAFILASLSKEHLKPSPEADRVTLIRRLSLDLTGLPPTIAEVDAFVKDRNLDAYEKVVERLLASPHYGERWGRHWLDVARYADSNGYSIDAPRSIWKYRDWIIKALNHDMPFDQFTIWQLAGDLVETNSLAPRTSPLEPLIASGFNRNTQINQEGGIDPEQFRVESVMDRVSTTATAWLGITLACAQCHDHKFDPFTQRDYYQFYAFFNSTIEDGHGKDTPEGVLEIPGENEATENVRKELEEAEVNLDRYLSTKVSEWIKWEKSLTPSDLEKFKPATRAALNVPFADRTRKQRRVVFAAFQPDDRDFKERNARLTKLESNRPKPITTLVMVERKEPRDTHIFTKGDFTRPAAKVSPAAPAIFRPFALTQDPARGALPRCLDPQSSGADAQREAGGGAPSAYQSNRLDLARWIVDTNNPLTARVIVNRIWQQYFGRGLVETENDFGTQGSPPSHPELLDWLACELMNPSQPTGASVSPSPGGEGRGEGGQNQSRNANQPLTSHLSPRPWSLKHLHRLIVTSATYRQSSKARPDLALIDPSNKLLSRQNRLRLDAEIVRDVCLTASGLLNDKIGGPSVFPPQPDGVMTLGQSRREWKPSTGPDRYRRGMYTFFWRATPHPSLMVFDGADGFSTCTRRLRSNTPLQALTLLNDEAFHEFAQSLAARVLKEGPKTDAARIDQAFRLCLSRPPSKDERQRLLKLLNHEVASSDEPTAWSSVARVLLNLDETITRE